MADASANHLGDGHHAANRLPAPCVGACPAGIDIPRYIGYVEGGHFAEAEAVVRESIPLPVSCGLICYRPCEPWCRRGIMEAPVAINAIKRAAVEHGSAQLWRERWQDTVAPPTGKRVAVVGSGPAGLTAAYYLAKRRGHQVTLLEAMPELGGQLRIGLPEYKVPRDRLRVEIELMTATRVEVRTSTRVESLDELAGSHDALFLALGQAKPAPLEIEGEELDRVIPAADFLRDLNLGRPPEVDGCVVIAGGNNIAVDSARSAVRLGASEVILAIPGRRSDATAYEFELRDAEQEGVRVLELVTPSRVARSGRGLLLSLRRLQVVSTDDWGRSTVQPEAASEFGIEAGLVLVSIGQRTDAPEGWELALTHRGTIEVDQETLMTSREGVFAGGDAATGPDSIVEAMAQGRRAAASIDRYLGGDGDISERFAPEPGEEMVMPAHLAQQGKPVVPMPKADGEARRTTFQLVETGYSREEAIAEAHRCIRCDLWRQGAPEAWSKQQE